MSHPTNTTTRKTNLPMIELRHGWWLPVAGVLAMGFWGTLLWRLLG